MDDMLAVCLVDLSPGLQQALYAFYAALPPSLRTEFPYLVARAEAEAAQLAATTGSAGCVACQAGLAMIEAFDRDDGTVDLDQLYWRWRRLTLAALAQGTGPPGGGAN